MRIPFGRDALKAGPGRRRPRQVVPHLDHQTHHVVRTGPARFSTRRLGTYAEWTCWSWSGMRRGRLRCSTYESVVPRTPSHFRESSGSKSRATAAIRATDAEARSTSSGTSSRCSTSQGRNSRSDANPWMPGFTFSSIGANRSRTSQGWLDTSADCRGASAATGDGLHADVMNLMTSPSATAAPPGGHRSGPPLTYDSETAPQAGARPSGHASVTRLHNLRRRSQPSRRHHRPVTTAPYACS